MNSDLSEATTDAGQNPGPAQPCSEEPAPSGRPKVLDNPAYFALREGDMRRFDQLSAGDGILDFSYADLAGVDLRRASIHRIVLRGARLKGADLRGLDLSAHDLDGASLSGARISGVLFPRDLPAAEILMSVERGTRLRHGRPEPTGD